MFKIRLEKAKILELEKQLESAKNVYEKIHMKQITLYRKLSKFNMYL